MITRVFPGEYKSLSEISDFVEKQAVMANFNPKKFTVFLLLLMKLAQILLTMPTAVKI